MIYYIVTFACFLLLVPLGWLHVYSWCGKKAKDRQSIVVSGEKYVRTIHFVGDRVIMQKKEKEK